jgi:hypothetical protein
VTRDVTRIHASDHSRGGPDPIPPRAILHIKLFPDLATEEAMGIDTPVATGEDVFVFLITKEMDGLALTKAEGFLSTPGSGDTSVMLRNKTQIDPISGLGPDMLEHLINIESDEETTKTATVQPKPVDGEDAIVHWGDLIGVDVTDAASGAHGLGIILEFSLPSTIPPEEP